MKELTDLLTAICARGAGHEPLTAASLLNALSEARAPATVKEWLETLPDGYRERAFANTNPDQGKLNISKMATAIVEAFTWHCSPEGGFFWSNVADHYLDPKNPLPPLP